MGVIGDILGALFGSRGNVLRETVETFRPNAEAAAVREAAQAAAALAQFGAEFANPRRSAFDALIDGVNRLPRPMLALGTIGLFVAALADPVWFAQRMTGVALIPEPLWWLMGAIVSFYFGARHQAKAHAWQSGIAGTLARAPEVARAIERLEALKAGRAGPSSPAVPAGAPPTPQAAYDDIEPNAALADWRAAWKA